jgi:hypothetical protein
MNMTPDQIEQWKDACNALRDGERIQVQLLSGEWSDTAIFDPRLPHRRKPKPAPWSLADHMRRFFPTWDEATMPLHRTDWTEDMLPDGWRPLLKGEAYKNGDEFKLGSEWRVETNVSSYQTTDYCHYHTRTRRPLPKAAPWTLPPPPAGQQWHRTDWTEDMLPEGWRPLLYDEIPQFGDQVWEFGKGPWGKYVTAEPRHSAHNHTRTMRPVPSPPRMVPLTRADVPFGSVFRALSGSDFLPVQTSDHGITLALHGESGFRGWTQLQSMGWLIHRPGDNDADGKPVWRKCEKEAK